MHICVLVCAQDEAEDGEAAEAAAAPQDGDGEGEGEVGGGGGAEDVWVACDDCGKWRRLPDGCAPP